MGQSVKCIFGRLHSGSVPTFINNEGDTGINLRLCVNKRARGCEKLSGLLVVMVGRQTLSDREHPTPERGWWSEMGPPSRVWEAGRSEVLTVRWHLDVAICRGDCHGETTSFSCRQAMTFCIWNLFVVAVIYKKFQWICFSQVFHSCDRKIW